jgi:hypothetical protein
MEVVSRETEIDLHLPFNYYRRAPGIVIILAVQCAGCVAYFPDTAEMITSVVVISSVAPTNALFALGEKTLRDCRSCRITLFRDRVATPDKCL